MTKPLVSIVCTVYNKEPWLIQTIDSFLKQQTDFPFNIVLVDDCSTDGSRKILQEYAKKYPNKVRVYYNEQNLGITRTWISICEQVEATYIARCDGDDYWTNPQKLQLQIEALKKNPQSKWCSTDIDFVDESGVITEVSVFETAVMPKVHDFETLLATRGFLAPSTWLVETELMKRVNQVINQDTADDTFDIQLELFQRTELYYIEQSTVAYRVNQGSDSRPKIFSKLEQRFNNLLATQKFYLDKYPHSDYRKMLQILLERNNSYEIELSKIRWNKEANNVSYYNSESITVYYDIGENGFNQKDVIIFPIQKADTLTINLPVECVKIRIDLSELPSYYKSVRLIDKKLKTEILPCGGNFINYDNSYFFNEFDPQLVYDLRGRTSKEFELSYEFANIDDFTLDDYLLKQLTFDLIGKEKLSAKLRDLINEKDKLQRQFEDLNLLYNSVIHSRRWTIPTKIIDFFRRKK